MDRNWDTTEDIYVLKLFDNPLVEFQMKSIGAIQTGLVWNVDKINVVSDKEDLFPYGMDLSSDGIYAWLRKRTIPKNRQFVEKILSSLGLEYSNLKGIIDISKGLSLNDSYWVVPKKFSGRFSEFNLYENPFDKILSLVAYTGVGQSHKLLSTSPELTTGGMLPKAWRMDSDGIYLYKGGTSGFTNSGCEPYSEFYASQIARKMGLDAVSYDLTMWKGILCSKCRLFTDKKTSYVPIGDIVHRGGILACIKYFDTLGKSFGDAIRSMVVFDALTYQQDRHFGNFGVLRDSETGKIVAPAPLFDNGISLFAQSMPRDAEDPKALDEYAKTLFPPYEFSFSELCGICMTKLQHRQLRKLVGFSFERHPKYNLPERRLENIERCVRKRVQELLDIVPENEVQAERTAKIER